MGAATFANVSSYDKGVNGILVDLASGGSHTSITRANILNDFTFKMGNNNSPNLWATVDSPSTVTVRAGAGVVGSDRVELIWPSGSIKEEWLEVTVEATANTGLTANDVFFFGSAVANSGNGDTATLSETTAVDEPGASNNPKNPFNNIPDTNIFDYNRDGLVSSVDQLLARNNAQTLGATRYINTSADRFHVLRHTFLTNLAQASILMLPRSWPVTRRLRSRWIDTATPTKWTIGRPLKRFPDLQTPASEHRQPARVTLSLPNLVWRIVWRDLTPGTRNQCSLMQSRNGRSLRRKS